VASHAIAANTAKKSEAMEPVKIGLVGVGGYARAYVNIIEKLQQEELLKWTSVVIRSPQKYPDVVERLKAKGVTIRSSLEEMLETDRGNLELVAIPTGIASHREQMIQAVEAGYDVVLEKPSAATIQDLTAMSAALDRSGKFCQVGFQNQSSPVVRGLKRAICDGRLGRIKEVLVSGMWPRGDKYYRRNPWAGEYMVEGRYVLDGTINNPMAHFLFSGLYFASQEWNEAAKPTRVRAELYSGHPIASEDTSALEVVCHNGVTLYFIGSLCVYEQTDMSIHVIGEKRTAECRAGGGLITSCAIFENGKSIDQTDLIEGTDPRDDMFRNAARHLRGLDAELNCPLAMTCAHVLAVNGAFESAGDPVRIPREFIETRHDPDRGKLLHILDIEELRERAIAGRKLFSDLGVPWAQPTEPFDLTGYERFERCPPKS